MHRDLPPNSKKRPSGRCAIAGTACRKWRLLATRARWAVFALDSLAEQSDSYTRSGRSALLPRRLMGHCGVALVTADAVAMQERNITKLTDTQLIILSKAAQRDDGAAVVPQGMKGAAAAKVAASLIARKLMREVRQKPGMPMWRKDEDDRSFSLVLLRAGREAIGVDEDQAGEPEASKPAVAKGSGQKNAAPKAQCWRGQTYTSLSTIALRITSTSWNGARFFGLTGDVKPAVQTSPTSSAASGYASGSGLGTEAEKRQQKQEPSARTPKSKVMT